MRDKGAKVLKGFCLTRFWTQFFWSSVCASTAESCFPKKAWCCISVIRMPSQRFGRGRSLMLYLCDQNPITKVWKRQGQEMFRVYDLRILFEGSMGKWRQLERAWSQHRRDGWKSQSNHEPTKKGLSGESQYNWNGLRCHMITSKETGETTWTKI